MVGPALLVRGTQHRHLLRFGPVVKICSTFRGVTTLPQVGGPQRPGCQASVLVQLLRVVWAINGKRGKSIRCRAGGWNLAGFVSRSTDSRSPCFVWPVHIFDERRTIAWVCENIADCPDDPERFDAASPISYMHSEASSCLILHGEKDPLAPSCGGSHLLRGTARGWSPHGPLVGIPGETEPCGRNSA